MAELFQNPSFFGGSLAPPESLIPAAPTSQDNSFALLMALMQVLPQQAIQPFLADVLSGKMSAGDLLQRLMPAQSNEPSLQGSPTQFGLNANQNIPIEPPSQYATTTAQLPSPSAPGVNNSPSAAVDRVQRNGPMFSFNNNPFYSQVSSPLLNEQGQEIGRTNLANNQFATPDMANSLLGFLSSTYGLNNGRVIESQYSGPTRPSQSELGLQFGNSPVINAGLEYQRLQNTNNYSRPYLDAQFQDTLQPGSSGWNNYINTGGQSINSAQAERLYAGNPATDPNVNAMGQAWKNAETRGLYTGPSTNTNFGGPSNLTPQTNQNWRSFGGNTGINGYAGAMNQRAANFNNPMNFRGSRY